MTSMQAEYPFTDTPSIDEEIVSPLKELLGDAFASLVGDFTSDFPTKFLALKEASISNDTDSIYKISHTLKSSSGSFGFMKLYKRLEHLELQARENNIINLPEQIDLLDQEFNQVVDLLNGR